jgi:hypothetical protein
VLADHLDDLPAHPGSRDGDWTAGPGRSSRTARHGPPASPPRRGPAGHGLRTAPGH